MIDRIKTRWAMSLTLACMAVGLGALPAQAAPQNLTFSTAADAYVDEAAPTVAKGATARTDCLVNDDVGSRRQCRLRFVVSGIQAGDTITSAKLRIRNKGGAGSKLVHMSTVAASPAWAENTITWRNKPPRVALQGSDSTHTWGVDSEFALNSGVVTGNGTYNFALHSPPASYTQGLNFHTKENTVGQPGPRLIVTINRPRPAGPAFGINVNAGGWGGARTSPEERLADFGRIPWARGPYYNDTNNTLPTTFDLTNAKAIAPERRLQMSFKRLPAQVLDGSYDAQITSYLNSIPAGWTVGVTYWHEPNGEIADNMFSATDFKAAWYRIGRLIESSTSAATLIAMPTYTGPGGARFDDSWMVQRALMPANSILAWDKYGSSPPPINAAPDPSKPYRGLYPTPANVFGQTMAATTRLGWADSWGVSEFNAPRRDADANEVDRCRWFIDAIDYLTSNPSGVSDPRHLFVWEGDGTQFDLNFYTQAMRDCLRPYFENSP